mmetsp:Transcript_24343/g.68386  ORF Transcript_24343/g.68386 Transcript_24343/m.68386 type:complete len:492 (+) Transcript_24343:34-1509(+)
MPWQLVPLHAPGELAFELAPDGPTSLGRRPTNDVVCRDLAVSGQHCVISCRVAEAPEIEDCSTNGTYINDVKLGKGQRQRLSHGDVVSLTKQHEDPALLQPPRVQFRLEHRAEAASEPRLGAAAACDDGDLPPTSLEKTPDTGAAGGFAQHLLVQEQRSKAKITGELLLSQRKLVEERRAVEAAAAELRRLRQQVDEERGQRREVEEGRDRLASEVEALRAERRELQELQAAHEELQRRHESADAELQARLTRCLQLEALQEELRAEVGRAAETHRRASQQHSELLTRARQAQERAERLEQLVAEAERDAERAGEEEARLRRELEEERAARRALGDAEGLRERLAEAEAGEREAREALDVATARRAELECEASAAQADAEAARSAARQTQQRVGGAARLAERLRESGRRLAAELRRRAELWESALADGARLRALGDEALTEAPTFARATCEGPEPERARPPPRDAERGCSTAWSLEVLELTEAPAKRQRLG